jgi:hypothetical protein
MIDRVRRINPRALNAITASMVRGTPESTS